MLFAGHKSQITVIPAQAGNKSLRAQRAREFHAASIIGIVAYYRVHAFSCP
jgi:hypothetical protein